jgi:hypothetical protein
VECRKRNDMPSQRQDARADVRSQFAHRVTQVMLILSCLGLGVGSAVLLLQDLSDVAGVRGGKRLGEVGQSLGAVRQRTPTSLLWRFLASGQGLYLRDTIQVGPESFASLKLDNGSTLEIGENSLVVLEEVTGLDFQILRGSLVVRSADGDQSVEAQGKNPPKIQKFPFQLVRPGAFQKIYVGSGTTSLTSIQFQWKGLGANQSVVEISRSKKFDEVVASAHVRTADSEEIKIPAETGTYYWRIASEGVGFSTTRAFEVIKVAPLEALFPLDGQKVGMDSMGVRFTWTTPPSLQGIVERAQHVLEVSRKSNFSERIKSVPITWDQSEIYVHDLPVGKLHWRIASQYDKISEVTPAHKIETFSLQRSPANVSSQDLYLKVLRSPSEHTLSAEGPAPILLEWQSVPGKGNYQFVVSKDSQFRTLAQVERITTARFELSDAALEPGINYWKVSHLDETGQETLASQSQKIDVRLPGLVSEIALVSPKDDESIVGSRAKKINLIWKKVAGAKNYFITLKQGSDVIAQGQGTHNGWSVSSLKPGKYEWEVGYEDRFGRKSKSGPPRSFSVSYGPRLRAPAFDVPGGKP